MGENIILKGGGGDLELETVNDDQWTRCYLVADQRVLLGADGLSFVAAGLLKALQDDSNKPIAGRIHSINVRYAFHLEETHHSLYYGDEVGSRMLFWQSDAHDPITLAGVIRLSPTQRRQWQETLLSVTNAAETLAAV